MLYTGETKEYYPDSTLKLIRTIRNGKENGTTSYYFSNGQIMEQREYRDGEKNGEWLNWNEKGIKIARAGYKNDKKEGEWLIWDDSGILRYKMYYSDGKKSGTWQVFDESGKPTDTITLISTTYKNGKIDGHYSEYYDNTTAIFKKRWFYDMGVPVKKYLIFYEIRENTIEIVAFWDNRQDSEKRKVR
jgi:antitoxin component YwqK of YwqJK toxin-antitoxin module